MTPDSLRQARALIESGSLSAVSFDVFDTTLLRLCTRPDGVIERTLAHAPIPEASRCLADSFVQHRFIAEYRARAQAARRGVGEVTIDEIYAYLPTQVWGVSPSARLAFAEAEFAAELDLCIINPEIAGLAALAHERGLRVGFVSDTYWSRSHLELLLRASAPGLSIDFLYASCDHGWSKASGLFPIVLEAEGIEPGKLMHIGDNQIGDVSVPGALGINTVYYPQCPDWLSASFGREEVFIRSARLRQPSFSSRLDGGMRVLRRLAGSRLEQEGSAVAAGAGILGPVFVAFQRFIEQQVAAISQPGRSVCVLFLARDAFLPMRIWNSFDAGPAFYAEINRRVVLVAGSTDPQPLQDLFSMMRLLDQSAVEGFLKASIEPVSEFFASQKDGRSTGGAFARELPKLLSDTQMTEVSRSMRKGLFEYLRKIVIGFDQCTDLVLVDLGYSGTIQRAMRSVLDIEGLEMRLHGVYLAIVDDNFAQLQDGDTATGFIDDSITTPFGKRMLLRNIAIIEQCCAAPVGSILDYENGDVRREADVRPRHLIERAFQVQEACIAYVDAYRAAAAELGVDPFDGGITSRLWATAMLSRLLMLPTREERQFLGSLLQDVNLGSRSLVPMIDGGYVDGLMGALPFPAVCIAREPPMWLGGSMAEVMPMAGYAYAMMGEGLASADTFADEVLGPVSVAIVKDGKGQPLNIEASLTGFGDVRLRIPVPRSYQDGHIALALEAYLARGLVKSVAIQRGDDIGSAMLAGNIDAIPLRDLKGLRAKISEHHFRADGKSPYLLIPVSQGEEAIAVVTLVITPLFADPGQQDIPGPRAVASASA